jgi:hypothetical protein
MLTSGADENRGRSACPLPPPVGIGSPTRELERRTSLNLTQSKLGTRASHLVAQIAPLVTLGLGLRILAAEPAPH